jgi:hypothetical protein
LILERVMAGLVPAIHVFDTQHELQEGVDALRKGRA